MLDLFQPPRVTPRPTRVVLRLDGEPVPERVCKPRKRPQDMSPQAVRLRALRAAWARAKRRSDPAWRDARNWRARVRYNEKRNALQAGA
jgi:hypothetical protein